MRVPRELLLDVVGRASVNPDLERDAQPVCRCYTGTSSAMKAGSTGSPSAWTNHGCPFSAAYSGGREGGDILSNSNTSAVDFVLADLTPGMALWR